MRRALQLLPQHLDGSGSVSTHVLSGFAEFVLQRELEDRLDAGGNCIQAQLELKFLGRARADRWLYGEAMVLQQSRTLVFATAELFDDQQAIALVSGIWRRQHGA